MIAEAKTGSNGKKRKSGIPSGNAGEYFVMGELLRQGFDAQLADRNTKGYDLLVGLPEDQELRKVQVKTVRVQPWFVRRASFEGKLRKQVTIYVLLGKEVTRPSVRFFIARNRNLAKKVSVQANWDTTAFMTLRSVEKFEDQWDTLRTPN